MDHNAEKDLMGYIGIKPKDILVIAGCCAAISAGLGIVIGYSEGSVYAGLRCAALLALVCAVVGCIACCTQYIQARSLRDKLLRNGTWNLVVNDFAVATSVGKDCVRIGERHVFSHHHALITDLERVYDLEVVYPRKGEPRLLAIDMTGEKYTLCFLPKASASRVLPEIVAELKKRRPRHLENY